MINFVFPGASVQEVKEKAHLLADALRDRGYYFDVEPGAGEYNELLAVGMYDLFYWAAYERGPIYEMSGDSMVFVGDH